MISPSSFYCSDFGEYFFVKQETKWNLGFTKRENKIATLYFGDNSIKIIIFTLHWPQPPLPSPIPAFVFQPSFPHLPLPSEEGLPQPNELLKF